MSSSTSIAIPSSTVVAIGAGFVGLALTVLTCLFLIRVTRLNLEARRRRRQGETISFREIWDRDGGMWGFLTGLSGDSGLVGAGGRPDLTLARLRNEIRMWEYYKAQNKAEMVRPKLWEVQVQEKGVMRGEEELELEYSLPLGAMPSKPPDNVEHDEAEYGLLEPTLTLSVLVVYPSQPSGRTPVSSDEWLDLPDLIVGTMKVTPYITPPLHGASNGDDLHDQSPVEEDGKEHDSEKGSVVDHYIPELSMDQVGQARRAGWRKIGKRWAIEGINDQEPEAEQEQEQAGS